MLPRGFLLSPVSGEAADTRDLGICIKLLSPAGFTFRKKSSARNLPAFKPGTFLEVRQSLPVAACQHADLQGESSRPASRPTPQQASL